MQSKENPQQKKEKPGQTKDMHACTYNTIPLYLCPALCLYGPFPQLEKHRCSS